MPEEIVKHLNLFWMLQLVIQSQKHEPVWGLPNRDCWGENRAGVTGEIQV